MVRSFGVFPNKSITWHHFWVCAFLDRVLIAWFEIRSTRLNFVVA